MDDDLSAARGLIYGILLSLPFWALLALAVAIYPVFGG
jgi:hypothetical protein